MILASFINIDEDALICDFVETYHIFDISALPARLAAKLAIGLKESSRIKTKVSGLKVAPDTFLLASIFDVLNVILWTKTEDGQNNRNHPKAISNDMSITKETERIGDESITFDSSEEYEAARKRLIGGE